MSRAPSAAGEHAMLQPLRDESRQLDPAVRMSMERSMGAPFGDIVVHTGEASSEAAEDLDAAAFTVGRHVVFGPGRYDPSSLRGRMLLAHELEHVAQQRRGGGDPDLGERMPLSSLTRHSTHGEGHGRTAAQAALGASAPVTGATGVGVARQSTEEERDWWDRAKEGGRAYVKGGIGTVEGVAMEGGQIVDTLLWVQSKYVDLKDDAIDAIGEGAGLSKETREAVKALNEPEFKELRRRAAESGMVDKDTGALTISSAITKGFDLLDEELDATAFEGMRPEDSFFTARDISQIGGAIGSQAALSLVGVEEVQLALKVVSGLGAFKAVIDAIDRNRTGFGSDRAFWMAVAQAGLHVIGLKSASSGKKLLALAVHIGTTILAASNEVANIMDAYNMQPGRERDEKLKAAIKGLIRVLMDQIRQMISSGKGLPKKGAIEESDATSAKPAPKATEPSEPVPPTTAPVKPPVTTPETVTSAPPKTAPVKPPSSKTAKAATSGAKGKLTPKPASESEGPAKTPSKPAAPVEEAAPAKAPSKTKSSKTGKTKAPKKPSSAKKSSSPKKGPSSKKAAAKQGAAGAKSGGKTKSANKKPTPSPEVEKGLSRFEYLWKKSKPDIWKKLAQEELAARLAVGAGKGGAAAQGPIVDLSKAPKPSSGKSTAGTSKAPTAETPFGSRITDWDPENPPPGYVYARGVKGWDGIDPVKALTDAELKDVAKTGKMPTRVQAELEHARIPQRVGAALVRVGVSPEEASAITKQTDPRNLVPANRESHAWMDEVARKTGAKRNPTLPAALDDRDVHPLGSATNEEIAGIIATLKKPGVNLDSEEGTKLRQWLSREKQARGASATWEVP
jgi:hypothetical protein